MLGRFDRAVGLLRNPASDNPDLMSTRPTPPATAKSSITPLQCLFYKHTKALSPPSSQNSPLASATLQSGIPMLIAHQIADDCDPQPPSRRQAAPPPHAAVIHIPTDKIQSHLRLLSFVSPKISTVRLSRRQESRPAGCSQAPEIPRLTASHPPRNSNNPKPLPLQMASFGKKPPRLISNLQNPPHVP